MKITLIFSAVVLTSLASAQMPPPGPSLHGRGMGFGPMSMAGSHKVVTNAPYSADVTHTAVQTLADGNTITHNTTGHVARDRAGRTYLQETNSGGPFAQNPNEVITSIYDPVAGYSYVLNSANKTATRRPIRPAPADSAAGAENHRGPMWGGDNVERVESDLGQQTIGGLAAQGKSVTRTIAAGAIGNSQPLVDKSEVWTSPDLQVVVLSKRTDPRTGQMTYALTNIKRIDPNPTLFQVPAGYTVEDAPARHRP